MLHIMHLGPQAEAASGQLQGSFWESFRELPSSFHVHVRQLPRTCTPLPPSALAIASLRRATRSSTAPLPGPPLPLVPAAALVSAMEVNPRLERPKRHRRKVVLGATCEGACHVMQARLHAGRIYDTAHARRLLVRMKGQGFVILLHARLLQERGSAGWVVLRALFCAHLCSCTEGPTGCEGAGN